MMQIKTDTHVYNENDFHVYVCQQHSYLQITHMKM